MNHTFPLFALLIDYSMNAVPVIRRHVVMVYVTGLIYTMINYLGTKVFGKVIYKLITWNDTKTYVIVVGLHVLLVLLFYAFFWINILKLKYLAKRRSQEKQVLEII